MRTKRIAIIASLPLAVLACSGEAEAPAEGATSEQSAPSGQSDYDDAPMVSDGGNAGNWGSEGDDPIAADDQARGELGEEEQEFGDPEEELSFEEPVEEPTFEDEDDEDFE